MFQPVYKWTISLNDTERQVFPYYGSDMSKQYTKESGHQFVRKSLNETIKLLKDDFDIVEALPIEEKVKINLYISYDKSQTWDVYARLFFYKTNAVWNYDDKIVEITLQSEDEYTEILAGLDKEYDLLQLPIEIEKVKYKVRACRQVYSLGEKTCGFSIGNLYWESEVNDTTATSQQLKQNKFSPSSCPCQIKIEGSGSSWNVDGTYNGNENRNYEGRGYFGYAYSKTNDYIVRCFSVTFARKIRYIVQVYDSNGTTGLCFSEIEMDAEDFEEWRIPKTYTFQKSYKGLYTQDKERLDERTNIMTINTQFVYERFLTNNDRYGVPVRDDDPIGHGKYNYCNVIQYAEGEERAVIFSDETSITPTTYGKNEDGTYWIKPNASNIVPIARNSWTFCSIWLKTGELGIGDKSITLKDAYSLASCINELLKKVAPGIEFHATDEYSEFLFGENNKIRRQDYWTLFLTQKTNILKGEYDAPARKAPCTLGQILDMLQKVFNCYWFIDNGKLRIEHIYFFRNGGSYDTIPRKGFDLTKVKDVKNGKVYGFGQNNVSYNIDEMPERYQFSWSDDSTQLFNGMPIDIISKFVKRGQIEDVRVDNFYSDIDYAVTSNNSLSDDGLFVLGAIQVNGEYELPIIEKSVEGVSYNLQNGYLSFADLQKKYLTYDMPARNIVVNGENTTAEGVSRKKEQTVRFPMFKDIETNKLVKSIFGVGNIENLNINLESRNAEMKLVYDTE